MYAQFIAMYLELCKIDPTPCSGSVLLNLFCSCFRDDLSLLGVDWNYHPNIDCFWQDGRLCDGGTMPKIIRLRGQSGELRRLRQSQLASNFQSRFWGSSQIGRRLVRA
jgi:hypothetical protein